MAATKPKAKNKRGYGEGEVITRPRKKGIQYALRFSAYGEREYETLGYESEGWDYETAEEKLEEVLAEVRLGIWVPKKKRNRGATSSGELAAEVDDAEPPRFGPFSSGLVEDRVGQVSDATTAHDRWGLMHLLPFFANYYLFEIDIAVVDSYRVFKVRESESRQRAIDRGRPKRNERGQILKPLSPRTINKTIDALQFFLGVALERKLVDENAAAGSKRRLTEPPKRPVHLDSASHIEAVLEVAAEMDRELKYHCSEREAIAALLVFAGARAHEVCYLERRDIDLANARIHIGRSKTQAGLREIEMVPILRDILAAYLAARPGMAPDDLVFPNIDGEARNKDTLRRGVLLALFERVDKFLVDRGQMPLPKGVTAHKLRHTFASILVACGEDPSSVMDQLGHTDPAFTLRVYSHMMKRGKEERARLKALVRGERVVAVPPPEAPKLECGDYEAPILRALVDRGGSAPRREVIAAVGEAMSSLHSAADFEVLASGPPRWEARIGKARSRMVERGWLKADTRRGQWEVTKTGRAKARRAAPHSDATRSSSRTARAHQENQQIEVTV